MKKYLLCFLVCLLSGMTGAYEHPGGLYSPEHLALVRQQVQENREPWKSAYDQLLAFATSCLSLEPGAVDVLDVAGYYVDADAHRTASELIGKDAAAAYSCALVYELGLAGNRTVYAEKARQMVNAWASINHGTSNGDGPLVFSDTGVGLIFGAELLRNYAGWTATERAVFTVWARDVYLPEAEYIGLNTLVFPTNNWGAWGNMAALATAYYLDDSSRVDNFTVLLEERIDESIEADGHMPAETSREKNGLWYTYFNLAPLTQGCQIAYNATDRDLFAHVPPDSAGIKKALDLMLYYCQHPDEWPYYDGTISQPHHDDWPANLLEAMYGIYHDPAYDAWIGNNRPLGTMDHSSFGWAFSTLMRPPDRVVFDPPRGTFSDHVQVTVSTPTAVCQVRYTTDGTEPTASSSLYTGPVTVTAGKNLWVKTYNSPSGVSVSKRGKFTVTADASPPTVTALIPLYGQDKVQVVFDEPVNAAQAADHARYTVSDGHTVTDAVVEPGGTRVTLTGPALAMGVPCTLTVNGIADRALSPNTLNGSFVFIPRPVLFDDFEHGGRLTWTKHDTSRWEIAADGDDHSLYLNTSEYLSSRGCPGEYALAQGHGFTEFTLEVTARIPEYSRNVQADYGVIFGYTDAANYCFLRACWDGNNAGLYKVTDGSRGTLIAFNEPFPVMRDKAYHRVRIEQGSGSVRVLFDNVLKGETALTPAGPGRVGVCSYDDMAYFDDFLVTDMGNLSIADRGVIRSVRMQVTISPNPVQDHAVIRIGAGMSGLSLYDRSGILIRSWQDVSPVQTIRWDGTDNTGRVVPPGVYYLSVQVLKRSLPFQRIVKKR